MSIILARVLIICAIIRRLLVAEACLFFVQILLQLLQLLRHALRQVARHLHLVQEDVQKLLLVDFGVFQHLRNDQLVVFLLDVLPFWVRLLRVEDSDFLAHDVESGFALFLI